MINKIFILLILLIVTACRGKMDHDITLEIKNSVANGTIHLTHTDTTKILGESYTFYYGSLNAQLLYNTDKIVILSVYYNDQYYEIYHDVKYSYDIFFWHHGAWAKRVTHADKIYIAFNGKKNIDWSKVRVVHRESDQKVFNIKQSENENHK